MFEASASSLWQNPGVDTAGYLRAFGSILRLRGLAQSDTVFRFAAVPVATLELPDPGAALDAASKPLAQRNVFVPPLVLVAAGLLLRRGADPGNAAEAVADARVRLREAGLPAGRIGDTLAALLLHLARRAKDASVLERMKSIQSGWKHDHRWLTGVDDLPLAALHALGTESTEEVAGRTEEAFQALKARGYWSTNELQLTAQMAALLAAPPAEAVRRFDILMGALRDHAIGFAPLRPVPVMLLALAAAPPADMARALADTHAALLAARPAPFTGEAFSIAALLAADGNAGTGPLTLDAMTVLLAADEGGCGDS